MRITPNQSYLVKQMQFKLSAAFAAVERGLGGNVKNKWGAWNDPNQVLFWPSAWRKDKQLFKARLEHSKAGFHACMVGFSNARWDSGNSDLNYGPKSIDQKVNERQDGKTKVIHNNTDSEEHVSYEESIDLTKSFSSSITKGVTLDMTTEAGVDASVTVGAEYAGVEAEASVASHFGISKTKSESSEIGKEESEEGTMSESLAIEFDAKPMSYYLIEVTKENQRTSQPFDIDGVMDFDIGLSVYDHKGYNRKHYTLQGVDAFEQFIAGYDTSHPEMHGWFNRASRDVKDAVAFIMDPRNRRIQVSGINHASLDSTASYSVELLGNHVPDALADLPVESV